MVRWEPNARERLERAALELFTERGYDATTVAQIADRAGLTKSTFFRHFSDKREVLFGGQDILAELFAGAIGAAPPTATTADCLAAALAAAAPVFVAERRDLAPQRQAVIAAHSELEERQLLKRAHLAAAIAAALRARGTGDTTARLAAQLGVLAFSTAFGRWAAPGNQRPYADLAREALGELQACAAMLGQPGNRAVYTPPRLRGLAAAAVPGGVRHPGVHRARGDVARADAVPPAVPETADAMFARGEASPAVVVFVAGG